MAKFDVPKIKYVDDKPPMYDELIAGVASMSYQSPIEIISQGFQTKLEGNVMKAIYDYGIVVDKEELIKALQYDRKQYEKGFADGSRCVNRSTIQKEVLDKVSDIICDNIQGNLIWDDTYIILPRDIYTKIESAIMGSES